MYEAGRDLFEALCEAGVLSREDWTPLDEDDEIRFQKAAERFVIVRARRTLEARSGTAEEPLG